jgi:hypothetical protein
MRDDPMTRVLGTFRRTDTTGFEDAWVGMEPTFQTRKSVKLWRKLAVDPAGEDAYFEHDHMVSTQKDVAKAIVKRYRAARAEEERGRGDGACPFARVEREEDRDQWNVRRQNLVFRWADESLEPFVVRLALDPETFEYSIKPVPLAWFTDERFARFCERFLWGVPRELGLAPSIAHGGAQFSLSAKTFMTGSLLADDIAERLNHPELATWTLDWPNPDDRSFRATRKRFDAFRDVLSSYWTGAFHPRATGVALTVEDVFQDRGFLPAAAPPPGLVDPRRGPLGEPREVFQTNFAFGRAVRLHAQAIHPGYWQSAHPKEDGYRFDQIMRYSEGNLNRLQIAGEFHVKSGKVLDDERVPEASAPIELSMLVREASWEDRAQMSRTSARDFIEAVLLDVHAARALAARPGVRVRPSLHQDQLLFDAEETLRRRGAADVLDRLRREARAANLEASRGRLRSDWVEPEALFWAAWRALPEGERGAVAKEAVGGFIARVEEAAAHDPRPERRADPHEWHRHRVHPLLWEALARARERGDLAPGDPVRRELESFEARRAEHLARRPPWSPLDERAPWEEAP